MPRFPQPLPLPARLDLYAHRCGGGQLMADALLSRTLAEAILTRCGYPTDMLPPLRLSDSALAAVRADVEELAGLDSHRMLQACLAPALLLDAERTRRELPDGGATYEYDTFRTAFNTAAIGAALTTAATAVLTTAYLQPTNTIRGWTSERDLVNFKVTERAVPVAVGRLAPVGRGGSASAPDIQDVTIETYQATRFGGLVTADEQDFLSDRLGAILELVADMGRQAGTLAGDFVYHLLLSNPTLAGDSTALFHADHGNTATTALDATNLSAAYAAMSNQLVAGRLVHVKPRYLVVNPTLKLVAAGLVDSLNRALEPEDRLIVRDDARLGAVGVRHPVTGELVAGSATTWFLAADAAVAPTIEVGYVNGRKPRLRETALEQGQWGFSWAIDLSVGACPLDWRGLYRGNV